MKNALRQGSRGRPQHLHRNPGGGLLGWATFPLDYASQPEAWTAWSSSTQSLPGGTRRALQPGRHRAPTRSATGWACTTRSRAAARSTGDSRQRHARRGARPRSAARSGRDTCSRQAGVDPITNFMDYTDDACMNTFTAGQVRAWTACTSSIEARYSHEGNGADRLALRNEAKQQPAAPTGEAPLRRRDGGPARPRCQLAPIAGRKRSLPGRAPVPRYAGPLFDAHLHYNDEAARAIRWPTCSAACSAAACARSSPTAGPTTAPRRWPRRASRRAAPASRSCPSCACTATVPTTAAGTPTRASSTWCCASSPPAPTAGPYRGLGEFHLYDSANADGPTAGA